jgi:hypothetical protein
VIPLFSYVYAIAATFRFPDSSPAQLKTAGRMLFGLSVILWPVGLSGAWGMARSLAIASTVSLTVCWVGAVRYDAERRALLHVIARLSGPGEPPTGPLRVVS